MAASQHIFQLFLSLSLSACPSGCLFLSRFLLAATKFCHNLSGLCCFKEFVEPKSSLKFSIKTFRMFFPVACRRTHISFYPTYSPSLPLLALLCHCLHAFCYCSSLILLPLPPFLLLLSPREPRACSNLLFGFLNVVGFFSAFHFVVVALIPLFFPHTLFHSFFFDINLKLFSFIVADSLAVMDFK